MLFKSKALLYFFTAIITLSFSACGVSVRNFPKDKPFVFANKIVLNTDASRDDKNRLLNDLNNYWDDSLKAKRTSHLLFFTRIKQPQTLDTSNLTRSEAYMNAYLQSQGYYGVQFHRDSNSVIIDSTSTKGQKRATVTVNITTGKDLKFDSVGINIADSNLQKLAIAEKNKTFLQKGKPVTTQAVGSELDRNVAIFRQNGYYMFTRENLGADIDTLDDAFKNIVQDSFTIPDPFELAIKAQEAAERRLKNPTADVLISLLDQLKKDNDEDSAYLKKYYVKNVYYYPDIQQYEEGLINNSRFKTQSYGRTNSFFIRDTTNKFRFRTLREHTVLKKGDLYDDRNYFKTLNRLSQAGAWQQVDAIGVIDSLAPNKDSVDFHIFLVPYKKYSFSSDVEISQSTDAFALSSTNFVGLSGNLTLRNHNAWNRAIQTATIFRAGVEFNTKPDTINTRTIQTLLFSLGHTITWPRIISPIPVKRQSRFESAKTILSGTVSYSDRFKFFRVKSLMVNYGYESSKKNKNNNTGVFSRRLNVELYKLDTLESLRTAFINNPFLRSAFNTGYIAGTQFGYNISWLSTKRQNTTHNVRLAAEESGLLFGRIPGLNDKIYQYIKVEGEYKRLIQYSKTALAFRGFTGIGYNLINDGKTGKVLPFFKQFVAGGPNSMRGWQLRQLGLGTSVLSDTASSFRDRFGDIQLELNGEYRFIIAKINSSFNLESALFADIGNIWNIRKDNANPNGEFRFSKLADDVAIAVGTGLRFNFNYFVVRLDLGFKLKDPAKQENQWLSPAKFTWQHNEFGVKRNNYALQVGIGMPF